MIHLALTATMLLLRLSFPPPAEHVRLEASAPSNSSPFHLGGNFRSPCSDRVQIHYFLPTAAFVRLQILSLAGKELIDLEGISRPSGHYQVPFDAMPLRPGLYFCRLTARTYVSTHLQTRKMVIF